MKNILNLIIFPIIVGLVLYFSTQTKAELNYFLSEKIPVTITQSNTTNGYVQLVEIRNTGKKEVKDIVLKIEKKIIGYEIFLDSQQDVYKEYYSSNGFELVYKELPVSGTFKLTLKTEDEGISKGDIQVKHNEGIAKNALDTANPNVLIVIVWATMIGYVIIITRGVLISRLEQNARYKKQEEVLRKTKPFYLSTNRWKEIRDLAKNNLFERLRYEKDIVKSPTYIFLEQEKPNYLSTEEWDYLVDKASEDIKKAILDKATVSYAEPKEILYLLNIVKPINFQVSLWEDIVKKLNKKYITMQKEIILQSSFEDIVKINITKPTEIQFEIWEDLLRFYSRYYFKELANSLYKAKNSFELLNSRNIEVFDHLEINRLKDFAQNCSVISINNLYEYENAKKFLYEDNNYDNLGSEYYKLKQIAERTVHLQKTNDEYNKLYEIILKLVSFEEIPEEKPANISEKEWERFERIIEKIKLIDQESKELKLIKENIKPVMNKVEQQLDLIDKALNDPSTLDRVEDYNNVFSKGNFTNLRRIVELNHKPQAKVSAYTGK